MNGIQLRASYRKPYLVPFLLASLVPLSRLRLGLGIDRERRVVAWRHVGPRFLHLRRAQDKQSPR
jgi:hypothetical protein